MEVTSALLFSVLVSFSALGVPCRMKPEFDHLSVTSEIYDRKSNIKPSAVLKYLFGRNGPLATTGCDHGAFLSTSGGSLTRV